MIIRRSYSTQMAYDVSDEEKEWAEKALLCFDYVLRSLTKATEHLDIMGVSFKDNPDIKEEELLQYRAALRRYRDKVIENFNSFKLMAFKCIQSMQHFESDTQTAKLMKSFISAIDSIEDVVNKFSELFNNLKSKTFTTDVNKNIDDIHKLCDELEEIIDDRIKGHIKTNILGKNWIDGISKQLDTTLNHKDTMLVDLMKDITK